MSLTPPITEPPGIEPFRIGDPLPEGTIVLEASAGTGKTWTIAALVTRLVAEGIGLDQQLVITFGRAASQEMRDRVREQIVQAVEVLSQPAPDLSDPLLRFLADAPPAEVAQRLGRLREAAADFDAATIVTTHQFCQLVLRSLGARGDSDGSAELSEDVSELVQQICDDLFVAATSDTVVPPFDHATARALANTVVQDGDARLIPAPDRETAAGRASGFAHRVRSELSQRKRRSRTLGFDDLITELAEALADPASPARDYLRGRWPVVLVDEFQDTDPQQWLVLERAFHGHGRLILIGDPKQAIYAFRGGDIVTYLGAVDTADVHRTLDTNWRSDAPLVEAISATLGGAALGDPRILVHPVAAAHATSRLHLPTAQPPFRLRVLTRGASGADVGRDLPADRARRLVARDLAAELTRLLASDAMLDQPDGGQRRVRAGDIAVLVSSGAHAEQIQQTLTAAGVPSVLGAGSDVLASSAADTWLVLLEAMVNPGYAARTRAAALTEFFGVDPADLAADPDAVADSTAARLTELTQLLHSHGIATVFESLAADGQLAERVLARPDGPRRLTDLRHVAQLLNDHALKERLGPAALLQWVHAERSGFAERSRRLDTDAGAVQILTVHRSKGLQYPIVYLPFLYERWVPQEDRPRFHDSQGVRTRDLGSEDLAAHRKLAASEDAGESLRLLYVALTRAQSQVVAWWAPTRNTANGPLHRVLFRPENAADIKDTQVVPDDGAAVRTLTSWAARGGPVAEVIETLRQPVGFTAASEQPALSIRTFSRSLDTAWTRTSYTGLTISDEHHLPPEGTDDEPDDAEPISAPDSTVLSPMADLPGGTAFGSLVHGVFETADFTAADLRAELRQSTTDQAALWGVDTDADLLADALLTVSNTPLGPLADQRTLADLLRHRQLKEMSFELPLGGGDQPRPVSVTLSTIADLFESTLGDTDPLRSFADRLREPGLADNALRGYLTGSLDLTLRIDGQDMDEPRFLVADYKTNWLGSFDTPLTIAGYAPDALTTAMLSGTYPLQATLYLAALHRFLRWRLPDYDPERHLGGVLYLYVRGMTGPTSDVQPHGVFSWHPPAAFVVAVSDALDGRPATP